MRAQITCPESCNNGHVHTFLGGSDRPVGDASPVVRSDVGPKDERERALICAACGASITHSGHRITVQDKHEHRFMNPAGIVYRIGCFAQAIGCSIVGPDSNEYPWFPGFAWRYALCAACGQHLGWQFRRPSADSFFGLILDRLSGG